MTTGQGYWLVVGVWLGVLVLNGVYDQIKRIADALEKRRNDWRKML